MSNTDPLLPPDGYGLGSGAPDRPASRGDMGNMNDAGIKEQAAQVAEKTADAGHHVAEVTQDEAARVAAETKKQAKELLADARVELSEQAAKQQQRVASGLRSLSQEFTTMADSSTERGVATELVQQAASRAGGIASWLEEREPGSLLAEVKAFARRQPGTFIAVAAVTGVLAGRLTRSVVAESSEGATNVDRRESPTNPLTPETSATVVGGQFSSSDDVAALANPDPYQSPADAAAPGGVRP